jgi:Na+/phosphate symporter
MDFNSITTSDPLSLPSAQIFRSNPNGKRPLIDSTERFTAKRTHPSLDPSIPELILQARSLIVKAAGLTKAHEEQTRLLDLIEVFREYTEKGKVITSSRIIASQVANLESTTRKIDLKAKELSKAKPTIAQVASTGANQQSTITTSYKPQEWQLVEKKEKKKTQSSPIRKDNTRRLILI